jgi:hypothetical protein
VGQIQQLGNMSQNYFACVELQQHGSGTEAPPVGQIQQLGNLSQNYFACVELQQPGGGTEAPPMGQIQQLRPDLRGS